MEFGPATYGDAFAAVYDEWYGSPPTEAALDRIAALVEEAGGPLLELGAGTGRLALPLAARGVDVIALDASAAMLDRLTDKQRDLPDRAFVLLADMARPALRDGSCGVVLCATNNLFGLGSRDQQAACLAGSARVLRSGGVLVVETAVPSPPPAAVERRIEVSRLSEPGAVVLTATERLAGTDSVRGTHVELTPGGPRLRPWRLALVDPAELDELALAAGLIRRARWANWSGDPFEETVDHSAITVYRRSED